MPEYYHVPNVLLCGPQALGFQELKVVAATHLWRKDVLNQTTHPAMIPNPKRHWKGATVSLVNIWSPNYFHWILESLAQLMFLERDQYQRILIPSHPPAYVWESLRMLNLLDCVVQWDGIPTMLEELYAYGPVRVEGHNDPEGLHRLRVAFYALDESPQPSQIYISRSNASQRRVLNENGLNYMLHKKGWDVVVHAESLSFEEQTKLFSKAEVILSPHGAGLTNMLWSWNTDCRIIELFGEYQNPCYEKLSMDLGLQYCHFSAVPEGNDMRVPLEELEKIL